MEEQRILDAHLSDGSRRGGGGNNTTSNDQPTPLVSTTALDRPPQSNVLERIMDRRITPRLVRHDDLVIIGHENLQVYWLCHIYQLHLVPT